MKFNRERRELIAMAVREVLDAATEPMTSKEIGNHPAVASLDPLPNDMSRLMYSWIKMTHAARGFPLKRIRLTRDGARWVYYNPRVVKIGAEAPAPVNTVNSPQQDFGFNPVEFAAKGLTPFIYPETNYTPPVAHDILPELNGAKSVTLCVAGVTIKIELTA